MKRLSFTEGSLTPIWTKDFLYMQDGFAEAVDAVVAALALGRRDFVISGCKVLHNGSTVSMGAGWCYYDGEVLPVRALRATAYSGGSPRVKLTRTPYSDPEGVREITLEGATGSSPVWRDDYLAPSLVSALDTYRLAVGPGAWDLGERIANSCRVGDTGVLEATLVTAGLGEVRYRRVGGTVQVFGELFNDAMSGFNGAVAQGLPRPAVGLYLPMNPADGAGSIQVSTNGTLSVLTKANRVHLDHVAYVATPVFAANDGHYTTEEGGDR